MATNSEKSTRVLVIDDEPAVTAVIEEYLETVGYRVSVLNTSQGWQETFYEFQPDVILLDITMPGEDGYAVCSQLKADPSTATTPVIFLTGKGRTDDQGRSFKAGADMFIKKPFSCERLLGIIDIVVASSSKR